MAAPSDERLRSTWSAVFRRRGESGPQLRLWEEWDERYRDAATGLVPLEAQEAPVLLGKPGTGGQVLLTTRRLVSGSTAVPVSDIVGVEPVDFTRKPKGELEELDVALGSRGALRVSAGAGKPFVGFWNVLLHIARSNSGSS